MSIEPGYSSTAAATGRGEAEYQELSSLVDQMAADMLEAWQKTRRYRELVCRTREEYARLAGESHVKAALRNLNKGRHPAFALGPVAAYDKNVHSQSVELLKTLGYRVDGNLYWLEEEGELVKLVAEAARMWQEVALREAGCPGPGQRGGYETFEPCHVDRQAGGSYPVRARDTPGVDAVQKRREDLLAAGEAGDAVIEINRAQVKASQVKLGTNPGLKPVLRNLEAMERAMPTVEIALKAARPKPPAPILDPFAAHAAAPPDLSKLPRHKVLRIADGDIIEVQKIPGVMSVRLLGVAAPAIDSPLLRSKVLGDLINGQVVALSYDPRGPLDKGRIVAQVYRVSDGLFVNLKLVQEGYGVTAANAPEPLQTELLTAEREAHAGQNGLWSPAAKAEAAALQKEKRGCTRILSRDQCIPEARKWRRRGP